MTNLEPVPGEVKDTAECKNCPDGIELRPTCSPDHDRWTHVHYNSRGRVIYMNTTCPNPYQLPRAEPKEPR